MEVGKRGQRLLDMGYDRDDVACPLVLVKKGETKLLTFFSDCFPSPQRLFFARGRGRKRLAHRDMSTLP